MITYLEIESYLNHTAVVSSKNANAHTRECLEKLGRPDRRAGAVIHVAGTNGKGSVCSFLSAAFQKAGAVTGLFTSPHLVRYNERIAVNGVPVSDEEMAAAFEKVRAVSDRMAEEGKPRPSCFEFLYLMAMVHFAASHTDVVVIETGLGGRLDATNSVVSPALTVITSISRDNMQYLGDTIAEIAGEKAGILKKGTPCVYDASCEEAAAVIRAKGEALCIPLYALKEDDFRIRGSSHGVIDFSTAFRYDGHADYRIRSFALWQAGNAALALLALKVLREEERVPVRILPDGQQTEEAFQEMYWPARMEEIRPGIYLDGAHNEDAVRRLAETAAALKGRRPAHLLFAVVSDKDCRAMIRLLSADGIFSDVIVTETNFRKVPAEEIAALFRDAGMKEVTVLPDIRSAFSEAVLRAQDGPVFICGSLYLAGEIRKLTADGNALDVRSNI